MTYQYLSSILGAALFLVSYQVNQFGFLVTMPLAGNLFLLNDTYNMYFELQDYDDTWFQLRSYKTFYGNTPYIEMRFPGAANLIRSSEVPGYHLREDRYGDNTQTRLLETSNGRWFLMNYTPGYTRI